MSGIAVAAAAGAGGMLGWGLADFLAKVSIDRVGEMTSLVWAHFAGTVVLGLTAVIVMMSGDVALPRQVGDWLALFAFGAVQALVYYLVYRGFAKGQLSILNPLFSSYAGLVALISILALGDRAGTFEALALLVVFSGVIVLCRGEQDQQGARRRAFATPGTPEIVAATGLAAAWTLMWDAHMGGREWSTAAFGMYLGMTITLVVAGSVARAGIGRPSGSGWALVAGIGIGEALAYASISLGFAETNYTSVVAVLSGAFSLPAIFLSRWLLRERTTRSQSAGAAAIILGTALVVGLGS